VIVHDIAEREEQILLHQWTIVIVIRIIRDGIPVEDGVRETSQRTSMTKGGGSANGRGTGWQIIWRNIASGSHFS
jgi:hypothetical protein